MTIQRRIVMSVEDIKTITFECTACSSRISLRPDGEIEVPNSCPQCRREWRALNQARPTMAPGPGPFVELANAIRRIRSLGNESIDPGFRIFIEFDE
jgi:DNA-directed RNA polymerase subunit RPC12/RpoP